MPNNLVSFLGLASLAFLFASCGTTGGVTNPLNTAGLSDVEIAAVNTAMINSMNDSNTAYAAGAAAPLLNPRALGSNALVKQIPISGTTNCAISGHITRSGNITVTASTTLATIYGLITFAISDPTNNLNDCEVAADVILNGTITLTFSGDSDTGVGLSMVGSIDINSRGTSGGLSPRGNCFISLQVAKGSSRATGMVCGNSVS